MVDSDGTQAEAASGVVGERPREERDVLTARTERRGLEPVDGQAVVEVGAKATALDLGLEVAVGGG